MTEVTATARKASIYALGMVLTQATSFIMLPIYTRFLTPAMYGTIEILVLSINVAGLVISIGIQQSFNRLYFEYTDEDRKKEFLATAFLMVILLYATASGIGFAFAQRLGEVLLQGTPKDTYSFHLAFLILFVGAFNELPLLFIQLQQKAFFFVMVSLASLIMQLSLNILFVVFLEKDLIGVLYSTLIAKGCAGVVLSVYYYKNSGFSLSFTRAKAIARYSFPLVFLNLGNFIITFADRYFLKVYASLSVVGVYSLGYKLGFLMMEVGFNPIMKSWGPKRFNLDSSEGFGQIHRSVFLLISVSVLSFSLFFILFSRDFFRVISDRAYWSAYEVVPYVMSAYVFQAWGIYSNYALFKMGKTKVLAVIGVFAAVVFLVCCFWLIPEFEQFGAAWATIVAMFTRFILTYSLSQHYIKLDFGWGKVLILVLMVVATWVVSLLVVFESVVVSIGFNALLFSFYLLSLWFFPVLTKHQKSEIINTGKAAYRNIVSRVGL